MCSVTPLNTDQQKAVDEVLNGWRNVFIAGVAGSGKSEVVKAIAAGWSFPKENLVMVTPTNTSCKIIEGKTINSFLGIGLTPKNSDMEKVAQVALTRENVRKRLRDVQLIIVDEVSMVHGNLLKFMKTMLEVARGSQLPYGGVRMVLVGDMNQLPPVVPTHPTEDFEERMAAAFGFVGEQWTSLELKYLNLGQIVRTSEPEYQRLLRGIAFGNVTQADVDVLTRRKSSKDTYDHREACRASHPVRYQSTGRLVQQSHH
jgi:ATP-dependent exoDNAse (exonuclease V) alpha subunit